MKKEINFKKMDAREYLIVSCICVSVEKALNGAWNIHCQVFTVILMLT